MKGNYGSVYSRVWFKGKQVLKKLLAIMPFKRPLFLAMRSVGVIPPFHQKLFYSGPFSFSLEGKDVRMVHTSYQIENNLF